MPARHNFNANRIGRQITAAASQGALEVLVQTQTEIQQMLSKPGTGKVYAKTRGAARRLDQFIGQDVGLRKDERERMATARRLHAAFRGRGQVRTRDVIGQEAEARQRGQRQWLAMRRGVALTDQQIQGLLTKRGKGGGSYANLGEIGLHRASAPGQPPAVRTGRLRRAVQMARPRKVSKGPLQGWGIGIKLLYAWWLEDGTERMKARPYVAPTIEMMRPIAPKVIANRIRLTGFNVT